MKFALNSVPKAIRRFKKIVKIVSIHFDTNPFYDERIDRYKKRKKTVKWDYLSS